MIGVVARWVTFGAPVREGGLVAGFFAGLDPLGGVLCAVVLLVVLVVVLAVVVDVVDVVLEPPAEGPAVPPVG